MNVRTLSVTELPWIEPVNAFWSVRDHPSIAFLDSAYRGHSDSRWSYLAVDPAVELVVRRGGSQVRERSGMWEASGDWMAVIRETFPRVESVQGRDAPPFSCGWVGWFGYELGSVFDKIDTRDDNVLGSPLAYLAYYDAVDCYDLGERRRWLVKLQGGTEALEKLIADVIPIPAASAAVAISSSFSRAEFEEAVNRAVEYINAGDIYQVNLSQQFLSDTAIDPVSAYLRLRRASPAPYSAFLGSEFGQFVSSSPELFFSLTQNDRSVVSRPIKGTRPRGRTHGEDVRLALELVESEKERAENIMIVDLVRNDLGRVCEPGTVETTEICRREIHPTVIHLVSTVRGTLSPGKDIVDVLKALFPGGSVTGAPKIRACEIIKELEPVARGPYTGAYGYISASGGCKLAMSIRHLWMTEEGFAFSAGGGIVADSQPSAEYDETLAKASAIISAVSGNTV